MKNSKKYNSVVILADSPFLGELDSSEIRELRKYFDNFKIEVLKHRPVIVLNNYSREHSDDLYFYKDIKKGVIELTRINFSDLIYFYFEHLVSFVLFLKSFFKRDLSHFLYNDFEELAFWKMCDRRGLVTDFVITNSSYSNQGIWFDKSPNIKNHMIWYSTNFRPKIFDYSIFNDPLGDPFYHSMKIDHHYVWDIDQKNCLENRYEGCHATVCGPILFYSPDTHFKKAFASIEEKFNIAVFDVVPYVEYRVAGYDELDYAYTIDFALKFINDIALLIERESSKDVFIHLKTKRNPLPRHHRDYINRIKELDKSSSLNLLDANINNFSLIGNVDFVICTPFTSPALIAKELGIPTIFYDPTARIVKLKDQASEIKLIGGADNLYKYVGNLIKES